MEEKEIIAFQFEFNCAVPDEERALAILEDWQSTGLTIREVFTLALLQLEQTQPLLAVSEDGGNGLSVADVRQAVGEVQSKTNATLDEIMRRLNTMQKALHNLEQAPLAERPASLPEESPTEKVPMPEVSADLVASLKKSMSPGIRLED